MLPQFFYRHQQLTMPSPNQNGSARVRHFGFHSANEPKVLFIASPKHGWLAATVWRKQRPEQAVVIMPAPLLRTAGGNLEMLFIISSML